MCHPLNQLLKEINMKVQGKVWGKTYDLFNKNNVEVHSIVVSQGGYCSKHMHKTKYNKFIVLEGELRITVWHNDMEDVTLVGAGEECTVAPGLNHMFEATEFTSALEIYWVELKADDIIRLNQGGMRNEL